MTDIGEKLRTAREAMGLSIADVEKTTKIQARYLNAIENDDFDKLPGDFYTRAFIRQYAQVVGLDGKKLLADFHKDVPESKPDEYVEDSVDNKTEEVKKTTNNKKSQVQKYLPRIATIAGIVIVVIIIYIVFTRIAGGSNKQAEPNNNVTVSSQTSSSKSSSVNPVKITAEGDNVFRVTGLKSDRKLVISAGANDTFMRVSFDGNQKYARILAADDRYEVNVPKDVSSISIHFNDASGTKVTIGGKKVPYDAIQGSMSLQLLLGKKARTATDSNTNTNSNVNTQTSQYQQPQTNNQTQNNTGTYSNNTQSRTQPSVRQSVPSTNNQVQNNTQRPTQSQNNTVQNQQPTQPQTNGGNKQ